jgi:serine phosphatase RsbU (regulator of sigma subunit)
VPDQQRSRVTNGYGRVFRASSHAAFVLGVLSALFGWWALEVGLAGMLPWTVQNILAGGAFVIVFGLAWGIGNLGGTLGWLAGRRHGRGGFGAVAGVIGFWFGAAIGLAATLWAGDVLPAPVRALLMLGFPLMGPWVATRWVAEPVARVWGVLRSGALQLSRVVSERLILTGPIRLDARGLVMGLIGGLLVGVLTLLSVFAYPEAIVLAQRIHFRNEPVNTSAGPVELSRIASLGFGGNAAVSPDRGIVVLQIDDWTQARLMTSTSQSAVNARLLRRLASWGIRHVVLPISPTTLSVSSGAKRSGAARSSPQPAPRSRSLDARPPALPEDVDASVLNPLDPPLDAAALARERRDLPQLIEALRQTPRAMLCLLPRPSQLAPIWLPAEKRRTTPVPAVSQEMLASLLAAGRPLGTAEFAPFYVRQVQSLRIVDAKGRWALPLLLASGGERSKVVPTPSPSLQGALTIGGRRLWLAAPGQLLVNVFGSRPGAIFPHVSYSTLLNGERIYDRRVGRWVTPRQFFQNTIVFLDALNQPSYDTPVGPFRATELLAMATDNVFSLNTLAPPSRKLEWFLLLLFGALAGHLAIGRSPLAGAARVAVLMVLYALTSAILFVLSGTWLPTVSVTSACAFAYLLVIQFVFAADEMELEQQRNERGQLEQEVAISRAIQTSLLPAGHLRSGAFEIVSRSEPAREVGGDFFNVFPLPRQAKRVPGQETPVPAGSSLKTDPIGIVLGDVSGKGVQGAMYMTVATTLVEARAEAGVGPEEVLAVVNAHLYPKIHRLRMFVTVFYGLLDVGSGDLIFASAGQVPPLHTHDGETHYQPTRGIPLGAMEASRYDRLAARLAPGDTLILASDGFIEAYGVRGEILGYDGFRDVVARHAGAEPHACLEGIFREVRAFSGDADEQDDRTLVVIRYHP